MGETSRRQVDAAEKIDEATRRYFQSKKGKAALAKTQGKYYQGKKKPETKMIKACQVFLRENPGKTAQDFLDEFGQDYEHEEASK